MISIIIVGCLIILLIGIKIGWEVHGIIVDVILQKAIEEIEELQGKQSEN